MFVAILPTGIDLLDMENALSTNHSTTVDNVGQGMVSGTVFLHWSKAFIYALPTFCKSPDKRDCCQGMAAFVQKLFNFSGRRRKLRPSPYDSPPVGDCDSSSVAPEFLRWIFFRPDAHAICFAFWRGSFLCIQANRVISSGHLNSRDFFVKSTVSISPQGDARNWGRVIKNKREQAYQMRFSVLFLSLKSIKLIYGSIGETI